MTSRVYKSPCGRIELREGRWQDVLADVEQVDAVITDPPYSERTHDGHGRTNPEDGANRQDIEYNAWSTDDVQNAVAAWASCSGWIVAITSHDLAPLYNNALETADRYPFAPLPFVAPGSRVRLHGDGPSSWTCWIIVARPRTKAFNAWGTLPGAYILPRGQGDEGKNEMMGGKPLWLMRALVRDYSRPGDIICDPCAGSGTTLLAAAIEGRKAIGSECDPSTYDLAVKRLQRGYTPTLF